MRTTNLTENRERATNGESETAFQRKENKRDKDSKSNGKLRKGNTRSVKETSREEGEQEELTIGTWNINSLTGKEIEVSEEMERNQIKILGLSETKKKGKGKTNLTENYILYYSGVNVDCRGKEGVGVIVTKEIDQKIIHYKSVNSRIMTITIKMKEIITVIQIYAPVEGTPDEETLEFYTCLQNILDSEREETESIIIMGDWNARVGRDVNRGMGCMGKYGEQIANRNGIKMIDFCRRNDLLIGNTLWEQNIQDKYTFVATERNAKSLIDFIVHTQELRQTLKQVMTDKDSEIGSNHRLVTAQLLVNMTKAEEENEYSKIAIYKLNDKENKIKYQKETDEEFTNQEKYKDRWTVEERWEKFREILMEKAEKICGRRKFNRKLKRTKWWDENIKELIRKKKQAWKTFIQTKDHSDREEYNTRRNEVKQAVKNAKRESWREFGKEVMKDHEIDNKKFWTKIKRLRGDKRKEIRAMRDSQNQIRTEKDEVLKIWKEYYQEKFNESKNETESIQEEHRNEYLEISQEEVEEAIQSIKLGKACGEDDLTPEMVKWMGKKGKEWLWIIIKEAWRTERIPKRWEKNLILPIYKKGDQSLCENYRAICLAQICFKVYTKILERRLRAYVERILEDTQAAFRPGRQINDNIFIVRRVIERKLDEGEELFLTFIDLKAAFDTVDREEVWKYLEEIHVPQKLRAAIESTYKIVKAKVQIAGKRSEEFELRKGIKQGDSLSPLLFIIIMNKIVKRTRERGANLDTIIGYKNLQPVKCNDLLYADDVVLIANSKDKMQKLINIWTEEIENVKMELNIEKTKVMIVNEKERRDQDINQIKCKGKNLEKVTTFEYLGTVITNDGKIDAEIANRGNKSTKVYYALNKTILGHKEIEVQVKKNIHNAITIPIITQASENWVINKRQEAKINAIEMKHIRKIAGKTKWDRVRNEEIRNIVGQEPIMTKIRKKQMNWFGHVVRMDQTRLVKRVMEMGKSRKRRRGRPRKKWLDQIEEFGEDRGKTIEEMKKMAKNRKEWKKWVRKEPESYSDT